MNNQLAIHILINFKCCEELIQEDFKSNMNYKSLHLLYFLMRSYFAFQYDVLLIVLILLFACTSFINFEVKSKQKKITSLNNLDSQLKGQGDTLSKLSYSLKRFKPIRTINFLHSRISLNNLNEEQGNNGFFQNILDQIPLGLAVIDQNNELLYNNQQILQLFDTNQQSLVSVLLQISLNSNNNNCKQPSKNSLSQISGNANKIRYYCKSAENLESNSHTSGFYSNQPGKKKATLPEFSGKEPDFLYQKKITNQSVDQKKQARNKTLKTNALHLTFRNLVEDIQQQSAHRCGVESQLQDIVIRMFQISNSQYKEYHRKYSSMNNLNTSTINVQYAMTDRIDNKLNQMIQLTGLGGLQSSSSYGIDGPNIQISKNKIQLQINRNNSTILLTLMMCEFEYQENNELFSPLRKQSEIGAPVSPDRSQALKSEIVLLFCVENITQQIQSREAEITSNYKMQMLGSLSHELKTPLNCSIQMLEVLQRLILEEDMKQNYLEPALTSNYLLLSVINDIIDFAQINAKQFYFEFTEFNLVQLLEECLILFKETAKRKGILLQTNVYQLNKEFTMIHTDYNRVKQMVINLLSNAFKFTQNGKIQLLLYQIDKDQDYPDQLQMPSQKIIEDKQKSSSNIVQEPNEFLIQVIDTGCGMTQEKQNKIFDLFGQADINEMKNNTMRCAGLGLTITAYLARGLYNNKQGIQVSSELNKGSQFSLRLIDQPQINDYDKKKQAFDIIERKNNIKKLLPEEKKGCLKEFITQNSIIPQDSKLSINKSGSSVKGDTLQQQQSQFQFISLSQKFIQIPSNIKRYSSFQEENGKPENEQQSSVNHTITNNNIQQSLKNQSLDSSGLQLLVSQYDQEDFSLNDQNQFKIKQDKKGASQFKYLKKQLSNAQQ